MPWMLLLGYSLLWAGLCDLALEASMRVNGMVPWHASVFLGIGFLWLVTLFLVALTGRLRHAIWMTLVLTLAIAGINVAKLKILAFPLVPADTTFLQTPGLLLQVARPVYVGGGLIVLAVLVGVVLAIGARLGRRYTSPARGTAAARRNLLARFAVGSFCLLALVHALQFNDGRNAWRLAYEATGLTWAHWDQVVNYQYHGFVGGALYNLPATVMEQPSGYGTASMTALASRYTAEGSPARDTGPRPNVVVVLNESLGDPMQLNGLELAEDPLVGLRRLQADEWGGELLVPYYGTGTSAVEFEILTGQSVSLFEPQITTPYQQYLHEMDTYPSLVGWLRSDGYHTVAVHPYTTQMYQRPKVYSTLGFDEFVSQEDMSSRRRVESGTFISDAAAYDEVLTRIRSEDDPVLAHVVTMQNHLPIMNAYNRPVPARGEDIGHRAEIEGWARGLDYSIEALDGLLRDLEATEEPTLVVFFGDHYPGIFSDRVRSLTPDLDVHSTPLLIWNSEDSEPRDLGIVSPTTAIPRALESYGMDLPPYYRLLLGVQEEVGTPRGDSVTGADGTRTGLQDLSGAQAALLEDLRMVQYDFSIGRRYAVDTLWYDAN